jgi:hypothetical protein
VSRPGVAKISRAKGKGKEEAAPTTTRSTLGDIPQMSAADGPFSEPLLAGDEQDSLAAKYGRDS